MSQPDPGLAARHAAQGPLAGLAGTDRAPAHAAARNPRVVPRGRAFCIATTTAMLASGLVRNFTGGTVDHACWEEFVGSYSLDSGPASPASPWHTGSSTCNRSYLLAALRAGVIALLLLGILALVVWF